MAIIEETYTDETATSTPTAPASATSELMVTGDWTSGTVSLQARNPQENTEYVTIRVVHAKSSGTKKENPIVLTPDVAVLYRAVASEIVGTVNIYMGP